MVKQESLQEKRSGVTSWVLTACDNCGASGTHICKTVNRATRLSEVTGPLDSPRCLHMLRSDLVAPVHGGVEWGINAVSASAAIRETDASGSQGCGARFGQHWKWEVSSESWQISPKELLWICWQLQFGVDSGEVRWWNVDVTKLWWRQW